MVTNLPPESKEKWAKYSQATTIEEKLTALRDFYSSIPKHKGTSKLCANIKRQISALRHQIEAKKRTKSRGKGRGWFVEKQGAAQIALIGLANSGKSTLLSKTTNAKATASSLPYETMEPKVGIYFYGDVPFQLIDTPSLQVGAAGGSGLGPQILALARNADGLMIVLDLSADAVEQLNLICGELEESGIQISGSATQIEFNRESGETQIKVSGKLLDCTEEDVRRLLNSYGIRSGLVKIGGCAKLEQIEDLLLKNTVYKPTVVVANKADFRDSRDELKKLSKILSGEIGLVSLSCYRDEDFSELGKALFSVLDIVRVYTKNPSHSSESPLPITIKNGATVVQVAGMIHTTLSRDFKYARVWGQSVRHDGQRVGKHHILADGDTIEIHCD